MEDGTAHENMRYGLWVPTLPNLGRSSATPSLSQGARRSGGVYGRCNATQRAYGLMCRRQLGSHIGAASGEAPIPRRGGVWWWILAVGGDGAL